jgi:Ala-tRNA(Pro) deacylase
MQEPPFRLFTSLDATNWAGQCSDAKCDALCGVTIRRYTPAHATEEQILPLTRQDLFERLKALDIATTTLEHEAAFTVAGSGDIHAALQGAHTKNLFLKDDKGRLVLIVAKTSTNVDLKATSKALGAGRFSFGKPDLLMTALGVPPGAVTAFAIANDTAGHVTLVIDAELMTHDSLNCHPLENTATTNIARDELLRFIRLTGHEPKIITLTGV